MDPLFNLSAPELRRLLEQLLPIDSDFDAFVLDYFPLVKRRFSAGMDRVAKTNLLFETVTHDPLCDTLRRAFPTSHLYGMTAIAGASTGRTYLLPSEGNVVIGRAPDCEIIIGEKLVSRQQAVLEISTNGIFLRQVGKAPIYRNGIQMGNKGVLLVGDLIKIQETTLRLDGPSPAGGQKLAHSSLSPTPMDEGIALDDSPEKQRSAHRLFWGFSDRLLSKNRNEEAERIMSPRLKEMYSRAEAGEIPEPDIIADILPRVLKLASATKKDLWFGWLFDFARICKHQMQPPLLDKAYEPIFHCRPAIRTKIAAYARTLEDESIVVRLAIFKRLCRE